MPVPLQCIGVIAASVIEAVECKSISMLRFETLQLTSCTDSAFVKTQPSKSLSLASEAFTLHLKSKSQVLWHYATASSVTGYW